jgi:thiosulfate dehydrogenase
MLSSKLILVVLLVISCFSIYISCTPVNAEKKAELIKIDLAQIPKNKFGDEVRYGRELMLRTAYYIGPQGIKGKYLGNKMNCTNCHQEAGTKAFHLIFFALTNSIHSTGRVKAECSHLPKELIIA